MQGPLGTDIGGCADKTGRLFQRRFSFHTTVDIDTTGQSGDIAPLQSTGEKDIRVAGIFKEVCRAEKSRQCLQNIKGTHDGITTPISYISIKSPFTASRN